ncbi:hypothetical protein GW17_00013449 [Ensete ventricosum]|nr:hypothetical protein GW17_00013449 [Ensete ventricosum]
MNSVYRYGPKKGARNIKKGLKFCVNQWVGGGGGDLLHPSLDLGLVSFVVDAALLGLPSPLCCRVVLLRRGLAHNRGPPQRRRPGLLHRAQKTDPFREESPFSPARTRRELHLKKRRAGADLPAGKAVRERLEAKARDVAAGERRRTNPALLLLVLLREEEGAKGLDLQGRQRHEEAAAAMVFVLFAPYLLP